MTANQKHLAALTVMQANWDPVESPRILGEMIETTSSHEVLDRAALMACERELTDLVPKLFARIAQPATRGHRSTLLYCCSMADCSDYFELLITILVSDAYGAAVEAGALLLENIDHVRKEQLLFGKRKIGEELDNSDRDSLEKHDLLTNVYNTIALKEIKMKT